MKPQPLPPPTHGTIKLVKNNWAWTIEEVKAAIECLKQKIKPHSQHKLIQCPECCLSEYNINKWIDEVFGEALK